MSDKRYKLTAKEAAEITRKDYCNVPLKLKDVMEQIKSSAEHGCHCIGYYPQYISKVEMIIIKNELKRLGYEVDVFEKEGKEPCNINDYNFFISWESEL